MGRRPGGASHAQQQSSRAREHPPCRCTRPRPGEWYNALRPKRSGLRQLSTGLCLPWGTHIHPRLVSLRGTLLPTAPSLWYPRSVSLQDTVSPTTTRASPVVAPPCVPSRYRAPYRFLALPSGPFWYPLPLRCFCTAFFLSSGENAESFSFALLVIRASISDSSAPLPSFQLHHPITSCCTQDRVFHQVVLGSIPTSLSKRGAFSSTYMGFGVEYRGTRAQP